MFIFSRFAIANLAVILFLWINQAKGQTSSTYDVTSPTKIYNPSQNATAMTKVADVPVNYYTGKPNVSFPFFQIKSGSLSHAVSLSYGGFGGIPVQQEATWVGLGWDLNTGGAITRSMLGKPDESGVGQGYTTAATTLGIPLWNDSTGYGWLNTLDNCEKRDIASGLRDCSPDMFFVNFSGNTAKMFFDKNGTAYFSPFKPWKVSGNVNTGFTITTEDGTRYIFTTIEYSVNDAVTSPGDNETTTNGNSAWFLTRQISANLKDTIQFNYTATNFSNEGELPSQMRYDAKPGQNSNCTYNPTSPDASYETTTATSQAISSYMLSSIVGSGGKIEFTSAQDRADMNLGNKFRLKEVNFYSARGSAYLFLRKFRFYQSYSNSTATDPMQKRLLLDSMVEVNGNDSLVHRFSYINPGSIPKKNSYSQDHWGYFNGASNTTLIPVYDNGAGTIYSGANREPDTASAQVGLLNTITYPEGGSTTFEYELNDYTYYRNQSIYTPRHLDSSIYTKTQNVNTNTLTTANGEVTKVITIKDLPGDPIYLTILVTGKIAGDAQADVWITDASGNIIFSQGDTHGTSMTVFPPVLNYGETYTLHAERTGTTERAVITIYYGDYAYAVKEPVYSKLAGGSRIKRIIQYDGINHLNDHVTRFKYSLNDSLSSGVLLDYPKYVDLSYTPFYCNDPGSGTSVKGGDFVYQTRQTVSLISLGRSQGSPIGYSKVSVLHGENGENGYDEYYYTLSGLNDTGGDGYPYIPRDSRDDLRGLQLQHRIYNSVGKVVQATVNTYKLNNNVGDPNFKWIWGAKYGIKKSSNTFYNGCPATGSDWSIMGGMYHVYQYWPVIKSTTDSLFDVINNTYLTTIKNFTYDSSNAQISREDLITSDSSILSTVYTYPGNYAGTAIYDSMKAKNMIAFVIEKSIYRNSIPASREKNNYSFFSGMILQSSKDFIAANAPLENRLNYLNYDARGNLLEQAKNSDVHEVYLWGYNYQYPVARIVGSTYAAVGSIVTDSILKNPSSDAALRTELNKIRTALAPGVAQITTYTFLPGIGVTSETTPAGRTTYFEYDGIGRLKTVKDLNGQIIKHFDYKFQVPVTQ